MSHPSRPWARGPAQRRRRDLRIEALQALEERVVLAPVLATSPLIADFTAAATPTNEFLGTVNLVPAEPDGTFPSPAPITTVSLLTDSSSFGGDIVRIEAGPGGDFGKGVYAISRGGGANLDAINRPGVIYRVDPATGKASVFFDLNTVIGAIEPGATAANSLGRPDRPRQLVRPRLRSGRLLRRPPLAVHLVGRRHRPEQERRLPGRPRRLVPGRLRPVPRRHGRLGGRLQPDLGPRPAPRAAELPARAVGRRDQLRGPLLRRDVLPAGPDDFPGRPPHRRLERGPRAPRPRWDRRHWGSITGRGRSRRSPTSGPSTPSRATGTPGFSGISPSFIFTPPDDEAPDPARLPLHHRHPVPPLPGHRVRPVRLLLERVPDRRRWALAPPVVFAGSIFVADLGTGVDFVTVTPVDPACPRTRSCSPSRGAARSAVELNDERAGRPDLQRRQLDGRGRRRRADRPHRPERSRRQRVDHRLRPRLQHLEHPGAAELHRIVLEHLVLGRRHDAVRLRQ